MDIQEQASSQTASHPHSLHTHTFPHSQLPPHPSLLTPSLTNTPHPPSHTHLTPSLTPYTTPYTLTPSNTSLTCSTPSHTPHLHHSPHTEDSAPCEPAGLRGEAPSHSLGRGTRLRPSAAQIPLYQIADSGHTVVKGLNQEPMRVKHMNTNILLT